MYIFLKFNKSIIITEKEKLLLLLLLLLLQGTKPHIQTIYANVHGINHTEIISNKIPVCSFECYLLTCHKFQALSTI